MKSIQNIMLRPERLNTAEEMYFFGCNYYYLREQNSICIKKNGNIDTGTYFNSFSVCKWSKYTKLQNLALQFECRGDFTITIIHHWLTAGDYLEECLYEKTYYEKTDNEISIDLSSFLDNDGIIYFRIEAHSDCYLSNIAYVTEQDIKKIRIALAVCTYKREEYIYKLINNYNNYAGANNLGIFIADNGRSLKKVQNENIHIFPNKNAGGAAGFARCMLEVSTYNEINRDQYDYIILMDDDICLDFHIFDRLISFISLLNEEFHSHFIAGAMCSLDYPFIQYEKYSSWRGKSFVQFGANQDLRDRNTVIRNERIEHFEHETTGWWFCCFSTHILTDNNYPFPCFFRGDDMEFSLRNRIEVITINGICVWHEPFYKKYSIVSEYYYLIRNSLVLNALYMDHISNKDTIKYLYSKLKFCLLKLDYDAAELVLRAGKDYLKGTDFFKNIDAEQLNKELMSQNHKLLPIEQLCNEYKYEDIEREIYLLNDKNNFKMYLRRCTVNGLLIPKVFYKPFGFALVGFGSKNINFYKVCRVLNFDPFTKKGYYTEINKKRTFKIIINFILLAKKISKSQNKVKQDYQIHLKEACTKTFWEQYLELD